jgi:hypothetical protein
LEELVEFLPIRSSSSAIRRSKDWTNAETAACASGVSVSQMICGSGVGSIMPMFYGTQTAEATMGLERLPRSNRSQAEEEGDWLAALDEQSTP